MADVFVSYASEDRDRVAPIVAAIEQAGFSVWWDRRIGLGSSFDREIERQLDQAACVVVVWSEQSVDSDWVRNEAQEGLERGILVPVAIDDTRPPLAFRRAQTARVTSPIDADAIRSVTDAIALAAGTGASTAEPFAGAGVATTRAPVVAQGTGQGVTTFLVRFTASDVQAELLVDGLMDSIVARHTEGRWKIVLVDEVPTDIGTGPFYIVTGSVRTTKGRTRVSCRIRGTQQGAEVASKRWDVDSDDILEVEDALAELPGWVMGTADFAEGDYLETLPIEQLDARGLGRVGQRIIVTDVASRDRKLALLKRASELDPAHGSTCAAAMLEMIENSWLRLTDELAAELISMVDAAVQREPTNEWVLFRASEIHRAFGDVNLSYSLAKRADGVTRGGYSHNSLIHQHRVDEAIELAAHMGPPARVLGYEVAGRLDEAEIWARECVGRWPQSPLTWTTLANVLARKGEDDEARNALAKTKALAPAWTLPLLEKGMRIHWRGDETIVDALVDGLRRLEADSAD